jgi:GT2 family glycosyltransferase/Flp pilus assembly protein TadD/SAM-dependent methyltransferase
LPRIQREQAERCWHTQYNQYVNKDGVSGWHHHELLPWAEHIFRSEYLVQRLSGIGLKDHPSEGLSIMSKRKQIEPSLPLEFKELYQFDPTNGCWVSKNGTGEFAYSDGDEVERRIYETVGSTDDLSSGSAELAKQITDWPSKYHLSSLRGNLLRPFRPGLRGKILEIGAGCGAITRFLGECGGDIVAVEGSQVRAAIAAARCRGLRNVNVIVDAAHRLPPSPTYDIVTLVGVLEYARKYFPAEGSDQVSALIRHAKAFLKPEGVLIVAIENQLGLKYFAGCDEDHVGAPMFGIEDRYQADGVVTFGRRELGELLSRAGLPAQSWWYPFPDYKLPTVVVSEKALSRPLGTKLHSVIGAALEMDPQLPRSPLFMLERAWGPVIRNGLGPDLANSFLVVAGMHGNDSMFDGVGDAYHFAVERKPEYAKAVVFKISQNDKITMHRELLYPEAIASDSAQIRMTLEQSEEFVEGRLWSQKLRSILSTDGWLLSDLIGWARRWYLEFLKESQLSLNKEELSVSTLVAGNLIDAIPRNLIVQANDEAVFMDKEWSATFPLELGYIVFRGLFLSLLDVKTIADSKHSLPAERTKLFKIIAKSLGLLISDSDLERYLKVESNFQEWVSGKGIGDPEGVLSSKLEIMPNNKQNHHVEPKVDGRLRKELFIEKNKSERANVSIIIPVFNKVEYTKKCIESIRNNTNNVGYEIIVINNGSTDATTNYLNSIRSQVKIINNEKNLGFSKACNQGIRDATAPYILFLNNDTEPQPGWLEPLIEVLDNDTSVAAVGSKLLFPDRTIQHAGVVMALHQRSDNICPFHVFYKERADLTAANRMMEYAVCTAACLVARAERLHWLGGFDEGFWNGYEDVDLCLRFCQNGWRIVYQPKSVLIHYESQSGPERFSKEKQNIELLQRKWRNKAPIDVIIHPDGKISQQKNTRIKLYFDPSAQGKAAEANHSENQKNQASAFVPRLTSIIMLTFNQLQYTKECVESIQKNTSEPYEIVFVDNGSSDGTVKWLRTLSKKNANFRLIENSKNLGFSRGCNQGIEASKGEYILLLNNDVVVSAKWLDRMLECLNSAEDIGIVGPMTNQISGPQKVPEVGYPSIEGLNAYAQLFGEKNRYRRVFYPRIVGFCMLFKRGLVERIGLFDERFGSGNFEDDDYCLRASLAGYRNVIAGDVFVHHYGSRSFIGNRIDYRSSLTGNRKIFNDKWSGKEIAQRYGNNLLILGAIHRADDFYRKGQMETAISSLLAAMQQAPGDKRLYFALAEMLIDSKRFQEAFELLEAMPQGDSDARKLVLTGCCEDGLGRCDQAEAWAEQALGLEPAMPQALNLKGIAVYKRGEKDPAERFFQKAIEADPSYGESYINLGVLKWDAGEQTDALSFFERGFILSPTSADALTAYHSAVSDAGTFAQAEPVLREAKALCPNDRRIAYFLIATLIQQQKHHVAMDEIEQVIAKFGMDEGIISAALDIRAKIGPHGVGKGGPDKSTLSLCMIVKNEEKQLPRCLMSAKPLADEIIVVDTGSNDRTRDIAKVLGAKVFDFPWPDNFSDARNFSIAQASGNWVLILDADEVLSVNDHGVLRKLYSKQGTKRAAYRMTTRNYTDEAGSRGWVENDGKCQEQEAGRGWFPSSKVRLFPKHPAIQFANPVHEMVEPSLRKGGWPIKDCGVPIHHYGKLNREKVIEKGKAYYRIGLQKLDQMQGDYDALKELAIQASEIGAYEEAVKIWHLVIGLAPEDASAFMNLGYSYLMLNQFDKAIEHSRKALDLNSASREAALNLSAAELIAGDLDSAAQMLDQLLTREPDYPPALGRLAAACILRGRKSDGLQCLNRLKEKGFEGGGILAEQAQEFFQAGKIKQAILLLETSIEGGMETPAIRSALDRCRSKLAFRENDDSLAGRAANHPFDQTEITAVQPLAL